MIRPSPRAHRRQNRRRAIVDALDIDIDDLVPSIEGAARPVAVGGVDTVIVEQHVDRTEMFVDADHRRADRGTIDHVDRQNHGRAAGRFNRRRGLFQRCRAPARQHHFDAAGRQGDRGGRPDAGARPRDPSHHSGNIAHSSLLCFLKIVARRL